MIFRYRDYTNLRSFYYLRHFISFTIILSESYILLIPCGYSKNEPQKKWRSSVQMILSWPLHPLGRNEEKNPQNIDFFMAALKTKWSKMIFNYL